MIYNYLSQLYSNSFALECWDKKGQMCKETFRHQGRKLCKTIFAHLRKFSLEAAFSFLIQLGLDVVLVVLVVFVVLELPSQLTNRLGK